MSQKTSWVAGVYDTNIVLDYAAGVPQARKTMNLCEMRVLCALSYMEILIAIPDSRKDRMKEFLNANFEIEPLDTKAMDMAIYCRNHYRMNMPDALIYGFARSKMLGLITRNIASFNPRWQDVYVPYRL